MKNISRRDFLKGLTAASLSGLIYPKFTFAQGAPTNGKIKNFISIFLRGGADGRVLYPYNGGAVDQIIRDLRGEIALQSSSLLTLKGMSQNSRANPVYFHPEFAGFLNKAEETKCGVALITEYGVTSNSSFSHEFAQAQLDTADDGSITARKGWLAGLIDTLQMPAMSAWGIGETSPLLFNSDTERPIVISSLSDFKLQDRTSGSYTCSTCSETDAVSSAADDSAFARSIAQQLAKEPHPEMTLDSLMTRSSNSLYPMIQTVQQKMGAEGIDTSQFALPGAGVPAFGSRMVDIARVIRFTNSVESTVLPQSTKIFCTALEGWDAHINLGPSYAGTIRVLASGLRGLIHHLSQWNLLSSTVIQVVSEFGRTTRTNVSSGLDHGDSNIVMIIGGAVNRGVYGPDPSVTEARNQNSFTSQVAFTGVHKQLLRACGFDDSTLNKVFRTKLPNEVELPFI